MGKLYVVMSGEFEEQIILTVCTNRKKAQEIAIFLTVKIVIVRRKFMKLKTAITGTQKKPFIM